MSENYYKDGVLKKTAGKYNIDVSLNSESTNAVQNKVVTDAINSLNTSLANFSEWTKGTITTSNSQQINYAYNASFLYIYSNGMSITSASITATLPCDVYPFDFTLQNGANIVGEAYQNSIGKDMSIYGKTTNTDGSFSAMLLRA